MSTSEKSSSKKKRRPLRKLLFLGILAGIGIAIKNAIADKGGSYEAPRPSAPVPTPPVATRTPTAPTTTPPPAASVTPPVPEPPAADPEPFAAPESSTVETAEEIVEQEPAAKPVEDLAEFAEPTPPPSRGRSSVAEALDRTVASGDDANPTSTSKIDPFGTR